MPVTGDYDSGSDGAVDDGSPTFGCDPVAQTGCDPEEKCTALRHDGQVEYACVSDPTTLELTSPCTADPAGGVDGCPPGSACLTDEQGVGVCLPLCIDHGDCDDALCLMHPLDFVPYCASHCSPFEVSCPAPLQCRRESDRFTCEFITMSDNGTTGDPCSPFDDGGCAPGFVCIPGALVPTCMTDSCCTSLCDLTDPDPCPSPATCAPALPGPAPGFEEIGACFIPS